MNLLLPLISFPYVVHVVGPEKFGLIAVATSVTAVLSTLCDYGSTFTGIRDVSRIAGDASRISSFIINAIVLRLLIFVLCIGLCLPLYLFLPFVQQDFLLLSLSISSIVPNLFYPQWLFVGLQQMKRYNFIIFVNKIMSIVLVFILIKEQSDYSIYPLVFLIPSIVSAMISVMVLYRFGVRFRMSEIRSLRSQLHEGFFPFISQSITSFYVQLNPLLLMLFLQNATIVGYYALAEKIVTLVKSGISPLNQLSLPVTSQLFGTSPAEAWRTVKALTILVLGLNTLAVGLLIWLAPFAVYLIGGVGFNESILTVRLLAPMMLFVGLNNIAGVHVLLNVDMKKEFIGGILIGVLVNSVILYILSPLVLNNAPAISWTLAELAVLIFFTLVLYQRSKD